MKVCCAHQRCCRDYSASSGGHQGAVLPCTAAHATVTVASKTQQFITNAQGLRVLRPRILAFLGRSGAAVEALVRSAALQMHKSSPAAAAAAAGGRTPDALLQWDLHRRAGLALPFGDIGRLQLWLDPLLPQARVYVSLMRFFWHTQCWSFGILLSVSTIMFEGMCSASIGRCAGCHNGRARHRSCSTRGCMRIPACLHPLDGR